MAYPDQRRAAQRGVGLPFVVVVVVVLLLSSLSYLA